MPTGLYKAEQMEIAKSLEHPLARDNWKVEDEDLRDALPFCVRSSAEAIDKDRTEILQKIEVAAISTKDRNDYLCCLVPSDLKPLVCRINLGLLEWITSDVNGTSCPFEDD